MIVMNDEEYREQARQWLQAHVPKHLLPESCSDSETIERVMAWVSEKHKAGYSAINHPEKYGGAGGTERQAAIFAEEEAKFDTPDYGGTVIGMNMTMDLLQAHGTEAQRIKYGKLIRSGRANVCQMFSEPSAGSDLAGIRTKAVKQGDNWILNGQKVWSSYAMDADLGLLVARCDPNVPKHKGLIFFIVDMKAPGLEVRPIRQISGRRDFNEIFLTDCAIPDDCRVGAEGDGWNCCMTILSTERNQAKGDHTFPELEPERVIKLIEQARSVRKGDGYAIDSALVRARIARFAVMEEGLRNFGRRLISMRRHDLPLPPTTPVMKLTRAPKKQQLNAFLMDLDGYSGLFSDSETDRSDLFYRYCRAAADRVAGGTQEIMLNQLSENALGMPRAPRVDKSVPFNQLPSGS